MYQGCNTLDYDLLYISALLLYYVSYMNVVTLSSKGQLVIPSLLRQDFNLKTGDEFVIKAVNNNLVLTPIKYKSLDELFSFYKSKNYLSEKDTKKIKKEKFSKA